MAGHHYVLLEPGFCGFMVPVSHSPESTVKHANSSDGFWVAQNFQMRKSTFLCDMDSLVAVMTLFDLEMLIFREAGLSGCS